MEGQWDIVVSSLQDIFNSNEELNFDENKDILNTKVSALNEKQLNEVLENLTNHKENVDKSQRVLEAILDNLSTVIATENKKKASDPKFKKGRSFWTSPFNESDSIIMGSEVAFRLRQRGAEDEWIQCEVTKVIGDGTRFEVRDPEPDENNNPGKTYKATWKDVIMIPSKQSVESLVSYPYGTKVLARYPETTTFYPAEVIGTKRDGRCRLKFEGEEEEGKETEVDRRLVVPFPSK